MPILEHVPVKIDLAELYSKLKIDPKSQDATNLNNLIAKILPIINPRTIYDIFYITGRSHDRIYIGGIEFSSHVLSVNLKNVERVFAFIATCGTELDQIEIPADDFLSQYWLDSLKSIALKDCLNYLRSHLKQRYALTKIASMSPGAGAQNTWPIEQQKPLFSLFGDVKQLIGVQLTDSYLMIPNKSVSGIFFPTRVNFESCHLCPREKCPGRRAPYDERKVTRFDTSSRV